MIGTVKKPFGEILKDLEDYRGIGVVGCDGCARSCATGGTAQAEEMAEKLREHGKQVIFDLTPRTTCDLENSRSAFEGFEGAIRKSDALLVLACGGGVQVIRQLTEEYGFAVAVKSGLDTVGHMDTLVSGELQVEQCSECGQCVLNETGAICPVTKCAKSLLNGPCGGSHDGKCETGNGRDCAWVLIYKRLSALDQVDTLRHYMAPKDHSRAARPRTLYIKSGELG